MATNQNVGTGLHYRARYTIGIPLVAASVAALFVIGVVLGTDGRPTLRSSVAEPVVTANEGIANQELLEEMKGLGPAIGTSREIERETVIAQAMADGATWRELTGESAVAASATIPDFAATDGVFPIPAEAPSVSPVLTGDDALRNAIVEMDEVNAVQPTMPLAGDVTPAVPLYEFPFEGAVFEALVERMLHGEAMGAGTATAPSVTDHREHGGLTEEERVWLEYELMGHS